MDYSPQLCDLVIKYIIERKWPPCPHDCAISLEQTAQDQDGQGSKGRPQRSDGVLTRVWRGVFLHLSLIGRERHSGCRSLGFTPGARRFCWGPGLCFRLPALPGALGNLSSGDALGRWDRAWLPVFLDTKANSASGGQTPLIGTGQERCWDSF